LKDLPLSAPALATDRLILRAYRLEDFDAYAPMWADPDVTRHIADGAPRIEEDSWASFLRTAGHWQFLGFGSWAIEEKASGRFIGGIGFNSRRRDRDESLKSLPELGWMFTTAASGKGYATEALRAALGWGRAHFGPVRVFAVTAPENFASMRVAEKCGFKEFHRGLSAGRPRVFFDRIL
jgi:RimJ/RimL family protein N-acetyltransferase